MRKILTLVSSVAVCLGGLAPIAMAQAPAGTERPKVLQIFVEETKPGRGPAHEKIEKSWVDALRKGGDKSVYLGMVSGNKAWYLFPRTSFVAAEQADKEAAANTALTAEVERIAALDGDLLSGSSGMWAVHRPELSYRADYDVAKMRYYRVSVIQLNPGYGRDFEQVRKLINAAHDKLKLDEHWSVYQVVAGAPDGTHIVLYPMASLTEWDKGEQMHGKAYQEALGDANRDQLRDFQRAGTMASETMLFNFSPKMSYLPKEFIDRDPDFWAPKPAAIPKKEEKK
jgi:hypothetical protein